MSAAVLDAWEPLQICVFVFAYMQFGLVGILNGTNLVTVFLRKGLLSGCFGKQPQDKLDKYSLNHLHFTKCRKLARRNPFSTPL